MQINPADAARLGIEDGAMARVSGNGQSIEVQAELTADMMPGVICIPHGFGHAQQGTRLRVASDRPGANSNLLANLDALDPLSGTSVLNGIPVEVESARMVSAAE